MEILTSDGWRKEDELPLTELVNMYKRTSHVLYGTDQSCTYSNQNPV